MKVVLVGLAAALGLAAGPFLSAVVRELCRGGTVADAWAARPRLGPRVRAVGRRPGRTEDEVAPRLRGDDEDPAVPGARGVPLATSVLFGLTAWFTGPAWILPALLYLAAVSVVLTLVDLATRRLPNVIVLPSYPVVLVLLTLASWNPGGEPRWAALVRAAVAGAAMLAVYAFVLVVSAAGMGLGDVKLAGVLGLYLGWFGWPAVVVGFVAAFVVGGVYAVVLMLAGRASRRSAIPFGPWMLLGCAVGIVLHESARYALLPGMP